MIELKNLKNKKIAVLCGGTSSEREISLMSGKAVYNALKKSGFKTLLMDVDKTIAQKLIKEKIDVACIMLHGTPGEDGTIQGMLELMGIPYTGCGVFSSSASIDKVVSKKLFEYARIPTAKWMILEREKPEVSKDVVIIISYTPFPENFNLKNLKFPVVVKPASQGSAIGISVAKNEKEFKKAVNLAFKYDEQILIEQYIKGTEITVGVLNGKPMPVIEIVPKGKFYDFKSKYTVGQSKHIIPARLPEEILEKTQEIALRVYKEFRCNGTCRVDMIVDKNNNIFVLELNTLPGMTKTSLFPDAAKYAGMNFEDLVLEILKSAK